MGTNYYMRYDNCECCSRHEEIHIGKKSYGWQFSFQAHNPEVSWAPMGYLGISDPKDFLINSWKDWQRYLQMKEHKIFDEYDSHISFKDLKRIIEDSKKNLKNLNHTTECHGMPFEASFYDKEGYSFSNSDFC